MKKQSIVLLMLVLLTSCVSKKKYVALEQENGQIKSELTKTKVEKEDLETKLDAIQQRIDAYNSKINSLTQDVDVLTQENNSKITVTSDGTVISKASKEKMRETLTKVDPYQLSQAKTLKDSMDLAVSYNLKRFVDTSDLDEQDDIAIDINETVVMISISDKMLFSRGSFKILNKADKILKKLADVINTEPSLNVMVEGHTDSKSIKNARVADNWDLSVLRATSVVRRLQEKYNVTPEQLIASGRSSYLPVADNASADGRARNRRTRIILMPNIDKFFALMDASN